MKKIVLLALLCAAFAGAARAEKADSTKETVITAEQGVADEVKQTRTLTGNVVLVKGTLTMKAGRALILVDPQGYQFATFWAAPGKLATFRQKRDGEGDLWVEGEAERVEYDDKTEMVKLFSKAKLTRLEGSKKTDEAEGPFISYDSRKELFAMENTASGESKPGGGSVRMVIQPTKSAAAAQEKK
ncbi:lipopolysaccharide export system protein LptA [Janthinobacterium sp. CG_23.3]|uniref:lipopolysaccharide transport periplasmic protein LptA n=1 Tax=unclassified Janthinobacterium TaxID=2610881 RepID=UPI00034BBEA8|nr:MULTISPECIES: lipopolysaccharide transport periplasmic protein LptA [unclassified Janthinobacterium]MEC5159149.1 lipopolysaccharide export system protein LptA [Janthinobacterium sp. CG_S6]